MWLCFPLAALLLAVPVDGQENGAEKLYRAMEKKVRSAKTLHVAFSAELAVEGKQGTAKGTVYVAVPGQGNLSVDAAFDGKTEKMVFITDGKQGYSNVDGKVKIEDKPKKLEQFDKAVLGMAARLGMAAALLMTRSPNENEEQFDLDKEMPIKAFKLGAKERVGKRNAQVVEYLVELKDLKMPVKVSVWIDTQTQLPLKRVLAAEAGATSKSFRMAESYSVFAMDGKIDAKLFEIPK